MLTAGKSTAQKIMAAHEVLARAEVSRPDYALIGGEVYDLRTEQKVDDYTAVRIMFNASQR